MFMTSPDRDWERFGRIDPYFAVITQPEFHHDRLDPESRARFFETGRTHLESVLETIRQGLDPGFHPERALDFGCGVGRVTLPLAAVASSVVGVDISPSMLQEAAENSRREGRSNVTLALGDDALSRVSGRFDLIHSFIVFQHIPPQRGVILFRRLVDLLELHGIGVLHFTYRTRQARLNGMYRWVRGSVPLAHRCLNLLQGRELGYPLMQMYDYRIEQLFQILQEGGCHDCLVRFTEHGRHLGVLLFFRKGSGQVHQSLPEQVSADRAGQPRTGTAE
jgi:SAM-dependent methyltransferase